MTEVYALCGRAFKSYGAITVQGVKIPVLEIPMRDEAKETEEEVGTDELPS